MYVHLLATIFFVTTFTLVDSYDVHSSLGVPRSGWFINGEDCYDHNFRCANEECIERSGYCNGYNDCSDASDENFCNTGSYCPTNKPYFTCKTEYYTKCVPLLFKCDTIVDCLDGSDERNCDKYVPYNLRAIDVAIAKKKALDWILKQRDLSWPLQKWGPDVHKIAVALHFHPEDILTSVTENAREVPYELALSFLKRLAQKTIENLSIFELASYINAFLASCIDPRHVHVDLVRELRKRVDENNSSNPFAYLALCEAGEKLNEKDAEMLVDVFWKAQKHFRTSTQATAILALACGAMQSQSAVNKEEMYNLTLELKSRQEQSGKIEDLKTTALVLQAIFAIDSAADYENFDEKDAMKYILGFQKSDGSFLDLENTYYIIPVLSFSSLASINSRSCKVLSKLENVSYLYLKNQVGEKWKVTFSLWIGDDKMIQRSLTIGIPANASFYNIMEHAAGLDEEYKFKFNMRNGKPHIIAFGKTVNDSEKQMYWTLFYLKHESNQELKKVFKSPIEVVPKDREHLVFWYCKEEHSPF